MTKAVQFDSYGGIDVLEVRDVPRAVPGAGEVLVEVRAAGINISEAVIRAGAVHDLFPATFPSGQGSDLAGVVAELGSGVTGFAVGDEVIGILQPTVQPRRVRDRAGRPVDPEAGRGSWEVAGSLFVAGATAYGAVRAVRLAPGDTVAIAGAAGGVGSIARSTRPTRRSHGPRHRRAVQRCLARRASARSRSTMATTCRPGCAPQHRPDTSTPCWISSVVDMSPWRSRTSKSRRDRVDTIADFAAVERFGVLSAGGADAATAAVIAELADLVARGELEVPIAGVFALDDVRDAYRELEKRHTRGK